MSESHQDRIERFRKPRVHIKYEVETGGAQIKVDLPFVVGVMGDFSGDPRGDLKSLDERNFTQIDRNNFDEVLRKMKPGLDLKVEKGPCLAARPISHTQFCISDHLAHPLKE